MDNRIFNVNGREKEFLKSTLDLAVRHHRYNNEYRGPAAWLYDEKHGLVLLWHESEKGAQKFPSEPTLDALTDMAWEWLKSDDAKKVPCIDWDTDADHDGHNTKGWRVYCENWGHVGEYRYTMFAVKPAFMWHGK